MVFGLNEIGRGGQPAACPGCGAGGVPVGRETIERMLVPGRRQGIGPGPWAFCESPDCDVVYFDGVDGRLLRSELSVRVGIKEKDPPRPVCYCFGHTIEEIEDEIRRTGRSRVADRIRERMKSEGCACERKSPRGSCCLSTVERISRELSERHGRSG